jgi:hypothetical protein
MRPFAQPWTPRTSWWFGSPKMTTAKPSSERRFAARLEVADDVRPAPVRRDRDGTVACLADVGDYFEALVAQALYDLGVVDDGAEAHHGAALPHRFFHHLDGASHTEAEAHFAGTDDLHVLQTLPERLRFEAAPIPS